MSADRYPIGQGTAPFSFEGTNSHEFAFTETGSPEVMKSDSSDEQVTSPHDL
jgi:hypothetical protein